MQNGRSNGKHRRIGFALGGLAGNNAHGAGVLQAALDKGVVPTMITCTSGQIRWTCEYLKILGEAQRGPNALEHILDREIAQVQCSWSKDLDLMLLNLRGLPGVFAPAYVEFASDLVCNGIRTAAKCLDKGGDVLWAEQLGSLWPCHNLRPVWDAKTLQDMVDTLRCPIEKTTGREIGVAFNAFDPQQGKEYVYLNDAARKLLHEKDKGESDHYAPGRQSSTRARTVYDEITSEAVCRALRLFQYGFDEDYGGFVDGAYFRDVLLNELTPVHVIYAARPMNHRWLGALPKSWQDLEDMKTEMWFNGCYQAEKASINLINKLIKDFRAKGLKTPSRYHRIDVEEIEVQSPRGYWDYVFEGKKVFDEARKNAQEKFAALRHQTDREPANRQAAARANRLF